MAPAAEISGNTLNSQVKEKTWLVVPKFRMSFITRAKHIPTEYAIICLCIVYRKTNEIVQRRSQ